MSENTDAKRSAESAQASVELVAVLPFLAISALLCFHLALTGWALWSAEEAARVASRADAVDLDARKRALAALPGVFRPEASVRVSDGRARVEVEIPTLAPGISLPRVGAEAGPVVPMAAVTRELGPRGS